MLNENYIYVNSIPLYFIGIVIVHFFCDWILQTRKVAENKSSNIYVLLLHCSINFIGITSYLYMISSNINHSIVFGIINVILHGFTDWNLWKLYKKIVYKRLMAESGRIRNMIFKNEARQYKEDFPVEKIYEKRLSRFLDKNLYAKDYVFYNFIAIDQMLHLIPLFWTIGYFI